MAITSWVIAVCNFVVNVIVNRSLIYCIQLMLFLITYIIINTFICNSTELDSHIQYIQAYNIGLQGNKNRRNMIRNMIHTKSVSFVNNKILT